MMIVNKDSVTATRHKLDDPGKTQQVIAEVKKILEIKEALLWRAEGMAPCCGTLCGISAHIAYEIEILQNTLAALERGDKVQAADQLEKYIHVLEASCEPSQPNYC